MNWSAFNSNENPSWFRFKLAIENAIWERGKKAAAAKLELFIKLPWKLNQIKMNWMCHILVATTLSTAAARWGKIATSWSFFIWCCCCVEEEVAVKNAKIIHAHANLSGRAQRHTIFFILLLQTRLHPHAPSLSFMHFSDDEFQHQQQSSQHQKRANIFLSTLANSKPAATTNKWINQPEQQRQWHRGVEQKKKVENENLSSSNRFKLSRCHARMLNARRRKRW